MSEPARQPLGAALPLIGAAVFARYHLSRRTGFLVLAGAVLDPFIYAGIVYFVLSTIYGLSGFDRYVLLVVGFIAFRWTLSCLLDAANFEEISARMEETLRAGKRAALVVILSPPSLVLSA